MKYSGTIDIRVFIATTTKKSSASCSFNGIAHVQSSDNFKDFLSMLGFKVSSCSEALPENS